MNKAGIKSIVLKKYHPYSSKQQVVERENLLEQDFSTKSIHEKRVGDITYINTIRDGWCHHGVLVIKHRKR
jgi:putative transposase